MFSLLLLALALSMDAFAAALSQGAARPDRSGALRLAAAFGAAQGVMPLLGWSLGVAFASFFSSIDHWIALILLSLLGMKMLHEGRANDTSIAPSSLTGFALLGAAVATSVDAAAAGLALPTFGHPVLIACTVIGVVTALISFSGACLGGVLGVRMGKPAELAGGVILIALGMKIFVEHQFLGA